MIQATEHEEGLVAFLRPEIARQEMRIDLLKRRSPRTWPKTGVNLVEWRIETIRQILTPGYRPPGAEQAPSLFLAVITEMCTEIRLAVFDAESEWDSEPESALTLGRLQNLSEVTTKAIAYTESLCGSSETEDRIRDLYTQHMRSRAAVLNILITPGESADEKRLRLDIARNEIRESEVLKARTLPELMSSVSR